MNEVLEGATELLLQFENLEKAASKRIMRAALGAGLRVITKAIKKGVTKTRTKPRKKDGRRSKNRDRRKFQRTIGYAVGKDRGGIVSAKSGVAVGSGRKGIKEDNWFGFMLSMGTRPRFRRVLKTKTVRRRKGSGRVKKIDAVTGRIYRAFAASVAVIPTGRIRAEDWVSPAYAASQSEAQAAIRKRVADGIVKEVSRG